MRFRTLLFAASSLATLLCSIYPAQAQLVNGSFELGSFTGTNPQGAAHSIELQNGATNITGWTVVNELAWLEAGNPYDDEATEGNRVLDLTGYHDSQPEGGVEQALTLVVGNTYTLGVDVGYNFLYSVAPDSVTVTIAEAGVNQTFSVNTAGTGQNTGHNFFQHFTVDFTATQSNNTLLLQGAAISQGENIGLDNVTLNDITPAAPAVPEPGGIALLLGMGTVGFAFLRRRKQACQDA